MCLPHSSNDISWFFAISTNDLLLFSALWLSLCVYCHSCSWHRLNRYFFQRFLTHSVRVFFLKVRLSDSICRFLGKLGCLTVWVVGVFWHITECVSFAAQEVQKLVQHIPLTSHWKLRTISCWGQKWVNAICVLLRLRNVVWPIIVGNWVPLQVFVCCWCFCFWKPVVRPSGDVNEIGYFSLPHTFLVETWA